MPRGRKKKDQNLDTNLKVDQDFDYVTYNINFNIKGSINLKLKKGKRPNVSFRKLTLEELEALIRDDPSAQADWEVITGKQDKNKITIERE